jgi:hypothetical protein
MANLRKSISTSGFFKNAKVEDVEHFYRIIWEYPEFQNVRSVAVRGYHRNSAATLSEEFGKILVINAKAGYKKTTTIIDFSTWRNNEVSAYGVWWTMKITNTPGCTSIELERETNPEEYDIEASRQ